MPLKAKPEMITIEQVADELRRELNVRERVYGRWIDDGRLTISQAKHQIDCLESAIEYLSSHKDYPVGYEPVDRTERKEIKLPWK